MIKKIVKEILWVGYFTACFMLLFGVNLQAYIDPSVVTYVIQAVAGIAVALGAAVGIYWRKAKKKLDNKLGIDENRNKTIESDDIEIKQ